MGGTGSRRPSHVLNPVASFRAGTSDARWWHVNFAGFCRRWLEYGETGRQLDSCLNPSATGVHRCPGVEGDEEREPPAQRRPIPTAQVDASRARQSSDSCRYQVWRNRIEAGPLSRCIKITLEDPPPAPLRGGLSIAGSWRPEPEPSSDFNLSPPRKGHQRPTTRDCSAARFLDSACWAAARENCSRLIARQRRARGSQPESRKPLGKRPDVECRRSHARISIWRR